MDSSWRYCPYCAREEQGKKKDSVPPASPPEVWMPKERQHTRVAGNPSSSERKTEIYSNPAPSSQGRSAADNRKIAGVLLSYSWNPYGQLYEVRQGRNHIGAGEIPGEDRRVDVYCPNDSLLSSDHAMILVQDGRFYIEDLASVNGTKVNGEPIPPGRLEPLLSPAEIRVGETVFTFVRFDVSTGTAHVAPTPRAEEKPPEPRDKTKLV
jgi:pSer/pThr/pTyr-binding forkhead associated (FHA) protein